ncbi:SAV_2336 N-terminal domain-related protein [Streptomyces sp. NPDC048297]|uniref:SAV_2336 N-terminal domain-related protein n=1 Tax=Streptomyces sp. NPDC048297 TaxID=3365531 RepID=UPI0037104918
MPSERPGSPDPLARLADVLAEAADGVRPTARELAELLWLARQMEPRGEEPPPSPAQPEPAPPTPAPAPDERQQPPPPPAEDPPPSPPGPTPDVSPEAPRVPLHLPSPDPSAPAVHAALLAPVPPMLRHPLGLQRALRPLKRRTDAPFGHRLDERATADRIARLGAAPEWWLPVLRPARERWLRLNLVEDTGPTMPVWLPLVRELRTALAQSGIFRTVTSVRADPDGTVHGHGAHAPADGRTVTLVLSDCMGPQWRPGEAGRHWYTTLRRWTRHMPVAVVQPLPEHLWRDTALPAVPGLLSAPHPAAPTAALTFAPYDGHEGYGGHKGYDTYDGKPAGHVPLPVLEPDPRWLANWAALLTSAGGTPYPGSAAPLGLPPDPATRTDVSRLRPEELVLRFRGTSSPQAFRLAGHLALGRPDLPVMRLVQRAVTDDPRPQHLAEVILSGLLTAVPGRAGSYAFRPGVRDLLLRGLPRSARGRTTELLARVGGLIEERAGAAPGEFHAVAPDGAGPPAAADGEAFATVRRETAGLLTGRMSGWLSGRTAAPAGLFGGHRLVRRLSPGGSVWLAERVADKERVALRLLEPVTDPARQEAFLQDAARLRELTHPNVVAVHDAGFAGDVPYVAMEYVDGIALKALESLNGYLIPPPLVACVGIGLARAVTALHAAGVTHGGIGMSRIMLLPNGTARLIPFAPGRTSGPAGRSEDLRALCEVMLRLTAGPSRLTLPVRPEALGRIPESVRAPYAEAFTLLMSRLPMDQARGADLLTHNDLLNRARKSYRPRRYHVLGRLHVELPHSTPEFAPLEQAALALLLLRNGRTVTDGQFRARLWRQGEEPEDARSVLTRVATRLRDALGPGALASLPDGYALHTSADYVDLVQCEVLDRRATDLAERGHRQEALWYLQEALRLWPDTDPHATAPGARAPSAAAGPADTSSLRLDLHRKRAELHLDMGEHERAATDLRALLDAYPDREDFRRLLLVALQHLGRVEEALEVYEEYEWSGGDDPALQALGHELRGDYADRGSSEDPADEYAIALDDDTASAPDEDPYLTESPSFLYGPEDPAEDRPLPQDEVPESLFAGDDEQDDERDDERDEERDEERDGEQDGERDEERDEERDGEQDGERDEERDGEPGEPAPPLRPVALFECADSPPSRDDRAAVGRAVVRLLVTSGLDPDQYELVWEDSGYGVWLRPEVSELALLAVTLQEFSDRVAETGGLRWRAAFLGLGGGENGVGREVWHPEEGLLDHILEVSGAQGIVTVSHALREKLFRTGWPGPDLQPMTRRTAEDGWFLLARPVAPGTAPPVRGPFRLPAHTPLPKPSGGTRAVVFGKYGPGFTLDRPRGETSYYEVDLTERRLELDELGPPVNGTATFEKRDAAIFGAKGAAIWRITDPVEGVRATTTGLAAAESIERHLGRCLREVSRDYPSRDLARSRTAFEADLRALSLPGTEVRWTVTLELARPSRGSLMVSSGLVDALREADAVLFGFDGVLTRLGLDAAGPGDAPDPSEEDRLTHLEEAAVRDAGPLPHSGLLLRVLADKGVPLAVVTNCSDRAVLTYLDAHGLRDCLPGGVHGRGGSGAPMPAPDRLLQAARRLGVPAHKCLLICATRPERAAAASAGIRYLHLQGIEKLNPLNTYVVVSGGLPSLLHAARSL